MDVTLLLRLGYLGAAVPVLFVYLVPALRTRFLAYGARATVSTSTKAEQEKAANEQPDQAPFSILLDRLAELQVPHSWFMSFYAVSVACSLFWASQLLTQAPFFRLVAQWKNEQKSSMTFRQVLIAWLMMLVQGSRRLYECLEFARPSKSQMWIGHWVLGIGFYIATSVAVWVEGIPAIQLHEYSINDLPITGPDLRTFVAVMIFILASGFQHDCHAYLASLKTKKNSTNASEKEKDGHKLPNHPAFASLIAPHYTAECLIYLSLAIAAAPQGAWLNRTLASALVFVLANLGVTADVTRDWYEAQFGREAVENKYRMIPFLY